MSRAANNNVQRSFCTECEDIENVAENVKTMQEIFTLMSEYLKQKNKCITDTKVRVI